MKNKLSDQLFKKYPKLFGVVDRAVEITGNPKAVCWGFECGDGWYWLIDQLCLAIQLHVNSVNEGMKSRKQAGELELQPEVLQVKEKFGGLRFYISDGDDEIYGMIKLAERMSYAICEDCGSTKGIQFNKAGWYKTRCAKCSKKLANSTAWRWSIASGLGG